MGEHVPDPACHRTGWKARYIEGKWRVGMDGNLDTIHDAVITVHSHCETNDDARDIAFWIVGQYNKALNLPL